MRIKSAEFKLSKVNENGLIIPLKQVVNLLNSKISV